MPGMRWRARNCLLGCQVFLDLLLEIRLAIQELEDVAVCRYDVSWGCLRLVGVPPDIGRLEASHQLVGLIQAKRMYDVWALSPSTVEKSWLAHAEVPDGPQAPTPTQPYHPLVSE